MLSPIQAIRKRAAPIYFSIYFSNRTHLCNCLHRWVFIIGYLERFCPEKQKTLKYPQEVRRLIDTTHAIEGFNRQRRKATKAKSVLPTDDSLRKMLCPAMLLTENRHYPDFIIRCLLVIVNKNVRFLQILIHISQNADSASDFVQREKSLHHFPLRKNCVG